jgi:hypothetical protein
VEDDRARPCSETSEVCAYRAETDGGGCSSETSRLRHVEDSTEQNTAASSTAMAAPELTATALQQRPAKMFVAGSDGPAESGEGAAVEKASNGLLKLAAEVIDSDGGVLKLPAIERKASLGYALDDEEALGYLLGDALDYQLEAVGARAVGKRAAKHVKVIKKTLPEKASAARRDARKAGTCPDVAAADTQSAYLREEFDTKCHTHPRRAPPQPPQAPPPQQRDRKRRREPEPRSEFDVPSLEAQADALKTAFAGAKQARLAASLAVADARTALAAKLRAEAQEAAVLARCDEEDNWDTPGFLLSQKECRRLDQLDEERVRAEAKAARMAADADAAAAAVRAADRGFQEASMAWKRMADWIKYPDVVTPFPWPGEEYILPCNLDDLEYYATCPRGYPTGVREWEERWYAHHRAIGLPLD